MDIEQIYTKKELKTAEKRLSSVVGIYSDVSELGKDCSITILIPVYNESLKRIQRQLLSFQGQKLNNKLFEIVYVVNNPQPDGSKERKNVIKQNAKILTYLKKKHRITVHVIDMSSKGKAPKICNVGIARNVGLHVVTQRYFKVKRDAIIIHTDADTIPTDKNYLSNVLRDMNAPRVYGAAGGVEFIMDIDSISLSEKRFFKRHIQVFRDYTEWHILVNVLQNKHLPKIVASPTRFFGAHMISKGVASVLAGGIPQNGRGEDTEFGIRLESFAKKHGGSLLSRWEDWIMQTAFRESRRTGSSFGPVFDNIRKHDGKPLVRSVDAPHYFNEYLPKLLSKIAKSKGTDTVLMKLLGIHYLQAAQGEKLAIQQLSKQLKRSKTTSSRLNLYGAMKDLYSKERPDLVFYAKYKMDHPLTQLTPAALNELRRQVYKDPRKKRFAQRSVQAFGQWQLPKQSKP